jgi:outer membrane murein-binding lipoprotein Lpp
MDQNLLIVMTVFVAVAAIALVIQAGMLIGIYKSSRAMQAKVDVLAPKIEALVPKIEALVPKIEALADTSREAVDEGRVKLAEITGKTNEILDITRRQLERVEDLLENASTRALVQLDRAEMVVDDAMNRAQETVVIVHEGIMKPIREINAVAVGLKAAFQYFLRGGRPNPDQVTGDDEMFI